MKKRKTRPRYNGKQEGFSKQRGCEGERPI